ncbi:MAG: T9SS type A sorting domain-containing protein [Bacteroidia bacterium]|nr:T9SS type A sorting domain-containing protein [Bacteroidia bacterium]
MNWLSWISEPMIHALGWALFHSLWQGILVVIALKLMLAIIKQSNLRYALTLLALGSIMLAFAGTFILEYQKNSAAEADFAMTGIPAGLSIAMEESRSQIRLIDWIMAVSSASTEVIQHQIPLVVSIWILGILLLAIRLTGGLWYLFRLSKVEPFPIPIDLNQKFELLKFQLGIKKRLKWIFSDRISEPITIFHLKPIILFPLGMLMGLNPEQLEAILMHELAHIRRADYLVNIFQSFIEIILFYHPAVWWISGRIRLERENCCDDLVIRLGMDPFSYAEALTHVQSFNQSIKPMLSMSAKGKTSHFTARIQRLFGHYPEGASKGKSMLAVGLLLLSCITFAFHQPLAPTEPEEPINEMNKTLIEPISEEWEVPIQEEKLMVNAIPTLPQKQAKEREIEPANKHVVAYEDEGVNIIIKAWTSEKKLNQLKRTLRSRDIYLKFKSVERDEEGKIVGISGSISFPDGATGSFSGRGINNLMVSIKRDFVDGSWMKLKIYTGETKNQASFPKVKKEEVVLEEETNFPVIRLTKNGKETQPLYVVDGEIVLEGIKLKEINPEDISHIEVIKGESAVKKYEELGQNGVVEIYSKDKLKLKDKSILKGAKKGDKTIFKSSKPVKIKIQTDGGIAETEPLYIIDGKRYTNKSGFTELYPNDIQEVNVIKGEKAIEIYGNDGKDGVVLIKTKKKTALFPSSSGESLFDNDSEELSKINVFPNSFKDQIRIRFTLEKREKVKITIFDVSGRKVSDLVSETFPKGTNEVQWDGSQLTPGVYSIYIDTGDEPKVIRVMKE